MGSSPPPDAPGRFFSGTDRIETWDQLGRPTRRGSLDELAVPDLERVRRALRAGDAERAGAYIDHLHRLSLWMNASWVEWAFTWAAFVEERTSANEATEVSRLAYQAWREAVADHSERDDDAREAFEVAVDVLAPFEGGISAFRAFREEEQTGTPERVRRLHAGPIDTYDEIVLALERRDVLLAASAFERWARQARARHDVLVVYASAYPDVVARRHGVAVASEGIRRSLELCGWYDELWELAARLSAEQLAAVLAEELRAHFSGPGRQGSVRVIEELDRFRLMFEPCGTGQVLRLHAADGHIPPVGTVSSEHPVSWRRAGEVPWFCAHCAVNEIVSAERLGHPAWVTDFDPDPRRPCGWTIYKDPADIPADHYERLGLDPPTDTRARGR